ncbi:MAG: PhzF family phenazine biosynthesis protein [Rubricoccaceae bacterium]|nr:PhzF family phenazine biosynthesis protein [Rubricoccaceae bacterium]
MALPLFQVDAFADAPFTGNPAAVCLLDEPADAGWMQRVAAEMNLSETAFLHPGEEGYALRWFTPATEVALCGHATLASAHVLYETGRLERGATARFHTASGLLTVTSGEEGHLTMDFPATPPEPAADPPEGLARAIGVEPVWTGRSRFDLFVEVGDEAAVRELDPEPAAVASLGARGIVVTARSEGASGVPREPYDFVSRFFAPGSGVTEDPVTGSAHCALAPYWAGRLGRDRLTGYQASARGGLVYVHLRGDRVALTGRAITVLRGELVV